MSTLINMKSENQRGSETKIQTFSFKAPSATSVKLVGDFTHWQRAPISLKRGSDNIWHATVELQAGSHRYRFLVDGQWRDDPECSMRVANPFGSEDDVRQV